MKFVGVRIETIKSLVDYQNRLKHNTRFNLTTKNLKDQNSIFFFNENFQIIRKRKSSYSINLLKNSKQLFLNLHEKIKQLNPHYRSSRTSPIGEGVLYFSTGINEDIQSNFKLFKEKTNLFFDLFEKKFNTDILSFQLHLDENGNYHIHFFFKNFDKENGKSLKLNRSNNGSVLQDISSDVFKNFGHGYERGVKNSKNKHMSVDEFKNQKMIETQKKEISKLNEKKEDLKNEINQNENYLKNLKVGIEGVKKEISNLNEKKETLKNAIENEIDNQLEKMEKLKEKFEILKEDFQTLKNEIKNEITDKQLEKMEKLEKLTERYLESENLKKLEKNLSKTEYQLEKIKKTSQPPKQPKPVRFGR